jgi:hypothetical protein
MINNKLWTLDKQNIQYSVGQLLKDILHWNRLAKWTETWEEASMKGPI